MTTDTLLLPSPSTGYVRAESSPSSAKACGEENWEKEEKARMGCKAYTAY